MIKDEAYFDKVYLENKFPPATEEEKQWFTERVSEYVGRGVPIDKARHQSYIELIDDWNKY